LKPELLVIGAEARTRLGSRLFGNTAQLLRDSACSVLAVPALNAARADDEKVTRLAA
jgi:nucleotide-binding universal stress UspA family protein